MFLISAGCAHRSGTMQSGPSAVTDQQTEDQKSAQANKADQDPDDAEYSEDEEILVVADPIYPWNFAMYHFNDKLYFWLLKPVATGYKFIFPHFVRVGVRDFFQNLGTPVRLVNSLFQLKIEGAGRELSRFVVNTTVGVLGFWDPAKSLMEIEPCDEDLGQTLGYYGVGNGFYIVWPVLGPSTLRDTFGRVGDTFLDPVTYIDPWWVRLSITGLKSVNGTSLRLGAYEEFKRISFDPYTALQDGYIQSRQSKVDE